nr:hypothetical protein [uncultured Schaedlerella sp.]
MQKSMDGKKQSSNRKEGEEMGKQKETHIPVANVFYGTKELVDCMRSAIRAHTAN